MNMPELLIRIRLPGAALAAALLAACGGPQGPAAPPPPPEVGVVTLAPERVVLTTELPGRTSAYLVAEVRPQVNGLLQQRLFEEGSDVRKGDLLYQIDPAPYRAAYEQAEAALAMAESNLPAARARAERLRGLVETRAVGEQDAMDAEAALAQAEASVAAARAALESARIQLSYTPIRAPIAGRTGRSTVTPGALVTAYQPVPLVTVQQLDPIYVDVQQSSSELLRLRKVLASGALTRDEATASRVRMLLEDGTPYPHEGTLKFQDVSVAPTTGAVTLRMVFPNPDHLLLPGMFVRAVVEEGVDEQAILVPQQAVQRDPRGNAFALVVGAEEKVEIRALQVGRAIGNRWLVLDGLAAGDRVLVDGLVAVRPGMAVTARPVELPAVPAAGE
ncbi:MAG: efflux RND transporter periplasmic adaptor subunit [Thermoanaerobaculia bacterium]|nr:efflux RND transporter periplasmic adaptor subunit [Thermoanaerobaculia bacterium]